MHGADLHPARRERGGRIALSGIRAILLDIEGTTTPIAFVHQVLFPYARARVGAFLRAHARDPHVLADVELLKTDHAAETESGLPAWRADDSIASAEAYVYWLMDRDRKSTALKSLQGKIWKAGYEEGELRGRGEVYADVRPALMRWHKSGRDIAIFSSGSIQSQQDLFANTTAGDLSDYLEGYFDTTSGPKRSASSYSRIASLLGRAAREVLFISDVSAELDAAREAGMQTLLCVRAPVAAPAGSTHPVIRSFDEVLHS